VYLRFLTYLVPLFCGTLHLTLPISKTRLVLHVFAFFLYFFCICHSVWQWRVRELVISRAIPATRTQGPGSLPLHQGFLLAENANWKMSLGLFLGLSVAATFPTFTICAKCVLWFVRAMGQWPNSWLNKSFACLRLNTLEHSQLEWLIESES